ncbi:Metallo-dependent phosphatase-like protein [Coemansia mojavensis]|nr:Metallo-dependent phosphatase-like protein [Coemansia mojavensis]
MDIPFSRRKLVLFLRVVWVLILFYGEIGIFYKHIRQCKWPAKDRHEAVHVAIIADPQIVDHYSYDQTGLLLKATEFFTDIYMRKSYIILQQQQQKPDTVVFLGDLMDGGREWSHKNWLSEYQRFLLLFRNRNPSTTRVYYMAGNHDIGIGNTVVESALIRFHEYVGPTNQVLHIGGHEIVLLDTLTLESDSAGVNGSSHSLVELLRQNKGHSKPRILFSHVPLWRPPGTPCGPLRQDSKPLLNRRGYQFRDQLFRNTTEYILDAIQPVAVFSGDDHDTCTVTHTVGSSGKTVTEYTIGAFGWASGVPIASYGLLTLYPGSDTYSPEFALQNCFLPYQLGIYKSYAWAFVFSLLLAIACSIRELNSHGPASFIENNTGLLIRNMLPTFQFPEKIGFKHSLLFLLKRTAYVIKDVAVIAVPAYFAFIIYFFII